ncbi:MAG: M23 family metallopeptidase [Elusimicrobiota bacterium]|nr:M23 family metallopeptidase [Elusimicrobiota bacterium]
MPRFSRGIKFAFYPWAPILFLAAWAGLTFYGIFAAAAGIDYNIIKADNKLMKAKLALIGEELNRTRRYLKMARETDMQMRQMLGMAGGTHVNLPAGIKQGREEREINFRDLFAATGPKEINDKEITQAIRDTSEALQERLASFQEIAWYYANKRNINDATPSIRPVGNNARITSGFGYRLSPFGTYLASYHYGQDFAGKPNSSIVATADGVVRQTGWATGYGQAVLIDHGFGYSTLYGHLADIRVKKGDSVKRGQVIASMGTTGRSTGVHVHYEVWKDGVPVNPRAYFK